MRIIGPNCLGVMSPRHVCLHHRTSRQRSHQPERCALHGKTRLEPARAGWLQRLGVPWVNDRFGLGIPNRVFGRRPVQNAGGLAVLATDSLVTQGSKLTQLSDETVAELNGVLPPHCSH